MRSIEITGKTVKDAINAGVAQLGCNSADVDIQVLEMGTPGLFGLFGKPAKVKLTVKEKAWAKQMRDDSITLGIEEETAETGEIRNRSDKMTKRTVENCRK